MTVTKRNSRKACVQASFPRLTTTAAAMLMLLTVPLSEAAENSVSIYGIIDVGVLHQSKTDAGGSKTSLETSGIRQSILGFKGNRDLGNGLSGFWQRNFFSVKIFRRVHRDGNLSLSG